MKSAESFDLIWLEQPQEWLVLFPDGSSLLGAFGSRGMALNAALRYLDRWESEFMVTRDDGDSCRYERAPEYWRSETDRARAYKPEGVSLLYAAQFRNLGGAY